MSEWNHPMCDDCWDERVPDQQPTRVIEEHRTGERCCWCGEGTRSGIYMREDPKLLIRHGDHGKVGGFRVF